ncbi:MAG: PD-(D/E)XK nuclease-like domain-containing protein [Planctomycetota bacterium]
MNIPTQIIREPESAYHEARKTHLSSHALADFRKSPYLFKAKRDGLIVDEDRPAFLLGRAAHKLILEGEEAYKEAYAFGGPINPKTGEPFGAATKAFADWSASIGKPVLTLEQDLLVRAMWASVKGHLEAWRLFKTGIPEGVLRAPVLGIPCQIRMDWFNPALGLVDLKTADNLDFFAGDARRYGYFHQMAFYQVVLEAALKLRFGVHIVAVEKKPPFRTGVWRIPEELLAISRLQNQEAMEEFAQCQERDLWPTRFEGIREFEIV